MEKGSMENYRLCLFVVGQEVLADTPVVKNVRECLTELFNGRYLLEVVDVMKYPQAALEEGVFFTPTLLRIFPEPKKRLIGNFLEREKIVQSLRLLQTGP